MALTQTVRCINKDDSKNPYERIINVGGTNADGSRWKQSQQRTIQEIDDGSWLYHAGEGRSRVKVVVAISPFGNMYIKTEADGMHPNNLLALPECP